METRRGATSFAVVGMGLNLFQTEEEFPPELRSKVTSLALSSSSPINRHLLTTSLISALYHRYEQLLQHPKELAAAWQKATL